MVDKQIMAKTATDSYQKSALEHFQRTLAAVSI